MLGIKALTFDTGGTILDWHTGISQILAKIGTQHSLERDWGKITNDYRASSLKAMINVGTETPATFNIDDVHRRQLDKIITKYHLESFTAEERQAIWYAWHQLDCWGDFPSALKQLRGKFIVASFTILSVSLIVDTAKRNGLSWDAVISCEMIGTYKTQPKAYEQCAQWLALDPSEILMVACHNFDLNAARDVGFKTAFIHRPKEWGTAGPPDPKPNPHHDIIANDFPDMARQLGIAQT